jgi:hypothetical protein
MQAIVRQRWRQRWNRLFRRPPRRPLTDLGCAYDSIGAADLASVARRIADSIASAIEAALDRMNELAGCPPGYDFGSIRALIEGQMMR